MRRPPFFDWDLPEGQPNNKKLKKLKNKRVRGHAAEDQNQIRASRVSRTIVRKQSQKWPEIEYMPTSNCSLHKNEDFQPQSFKVATILKQQRGEKWWSGWDWFSHSYAVNNLKLTYIPFLSGFGFSREYGRFNQVGQVSALIPWQKLDSHQIF